MKALLILIVTVGTSQANVDTVDSSLDVRQIEFESITACEQAASRLTHAGRVTVRRLEEDVARTLDWAEIEPAAWGRSRGGPEAAPGAPGTRESGEGQAGASSTDSGETGPGGAESGELAERQTGAQHSEAGADAQLVRIFFSGRSGIEWIRGTGVLHLDVLIWLMALLQCFNLLLATNLYPGQCLYHFVINTVEHGREHFKRFAFVFLYRIFLRVSTQPDTLPQVVHRCQMIFPVTIEDHQGDFLFETD